MRRRGHLEERTVDAVADAKFILEWLEMNIGGLVLNRLAKDKIDESYDWCLIGFFFLDRDCPAPVHAHRSENESHQVGVFPGTAFGSMLSRTVSLWSLSIATGFEWDELRLD